ncbi:hypothetical protein [Bacteroides thetaiotaomicron]|uniref:hypothetical protein n=1 Tax=Bacteroides thetaiotaomicron TaxID=818 RepID=UPI0018A17C7E|nr:hypothetical protein [Bacteroides thetaiotaomicron]MDC2233531.1 hypothetical protein [Bacteroides thetaiotaomicron]
MPTILKETYPTAQKEHICEFCGCKIQPGQKYVRQTNVYDGIVYDFVTHRECKEVAHELRMYDDCDDEGLDGESFRENLNAYVYANHYDEHTDDVYTSWQLNDYEIVKKVLKELKTEE